MNIKRNPAIISAISMFLIEVHIFVPWKLLEIFTRIEISEGIQDFTNHITVCIFIMLETFPYAELSQYYK